MLGFNIANDGYYQKIEKAGPELMVNQWNSFELWLPCPLF